MVQLLLAIIPQTKYKLNENCFNSIERTGFILDRLKDISTERFPYEKLDLKDINTVPIIYQKLVLQQIFKNYIKYLKRFNKIYKEVLEYSCKTSGQINGYYNLMDSVYYALKEAGNGFINWYAKNNALIMDLSEDEFPEIELAKKLVEELDIEHKKNFLTLTNYIKML